MSRYETAHAFFETCETGEGWDGCKSWCHDGATFSCQADALADTTTLAAYADWMKGLLTPVPDGRYKLTAFAADEGAAQLLRALSSTAPRPLRVVPFHPQENLSSKTTPMSCNSKATRSAT